MRARSLTILAFTLAQALPIALASEAQLAEQYSPNSVSLTVPCEDTGALVWETGLPNPDGYPILSGEAVYLSAGVTSAQLTIYIDDVEIAAIPEVGSATGDATIINREAFGIGFYVEALIEPQSSGKLSINCDESFYAGLRGPFDTSEVGANECGTTAGHGYRKAAQLHVFSTGECVATLTTANEAFSDDAAIIQTIPLLEPEDCRPGTSATFSWNSDLPDSSAWRLTTTQPVLVLSSTSGQTTLNLNLAPSEEYCFGDLNPIGTFPDARSISENDVEITFVLLDSSSQSTRLKGVLDEPLTTMEIVGRVLSNMAGAIVGVTLAILLARQLRS